MTRLPAISSVLFFSSVLIFLVSAAACAGKQPTQSVEPAELSIDAFTGINLEGVAYPYPVQRYEFESQQNTLSMAYMDVPAEQSQANDTLPGEGQAVLLLHGKNFNGAYWDRTARDLSKAGYRVVIPDQVGFGKSTKPASYQYSFQQLVINTEKLLDHLEIDRAVVLGHSMGGMLAMRFAIDRPERVSELVLLNPIGLEDWKRFGVPYQSIDDWYQGELNKTAEKIKAYQQASYYDGQWKEAYDPWVELLAAPLASPDYPRLAWNQALTYDMIFTQPVVYELDRITMPTLLIIGTRDRTALGKNKVEPAVAAQMGLYENLGKRTARQIPNAELVELNDIGHLPHIESYDRFIDALTQWLEDQGP